MRSRQVFPIYAWHLAGYIDHDRYRKIRMHGRWMRESLFASAISHLIRLLYPEPCIGSGLSNSYVDSRRVSTVSISRRL